MPQRSNIPGGTAYSYAGKEGPKASSPVKQKPLQSSPTKGKGKSISGTSVNRKAAAQDAPPQAISTSASIRGTTLEKALKRLDKLITIGEKLRQSNQDSAWKGSDLTATMLGVSGGDQGAECDVNAVDDICTGLAAVRRLVGEANEVQKMLETQTAASRDVAVKTLAELDEVRKQHTVEIESLSAASSNTVPSEKVAMLEKEIADLQQALANSEASAETQKTELDSALARAKSAAVDDAAAHRAQLEAAIEQERTTWSSKYAALEAEYKDLEPRYTAAMDGQRGRIRLLETQLEAARSKPKVDDSDKVTMLSTELKTMAKTVATLSVERDELHANLESTITARNQLMADAKASEGKLWLQEQKLTEFEEGLVDAIGQRKAIETEADQLRAASVETQAQIDRLRSEVENARDVISRLTEICDMRLVRLCRTDNATDFGMQIGHHPVGVVVTEVRPDGPAAASGIVSGDYLAAVNSTWAVGLGVDSLSATISGAGLTLDLIVAPDTIVQAALMDGEEEEYDDEEPAGSARSNDPTEQTGAGTSPFVVLLSAATTRKGMTVVVEATLVNSDVTYYENALQHDGSTGTIVEVDIEDEACLVDFELGLTTWLPLGSLAYIPPGKTWTAWQKSTKGQLAAALEETTAEAANEATNGNGNAPTPLAQDLVEKIAAAVGNGDA